jgi:hypothetical protein
MVCLTSGSRTELRCRSSSPPGWRSGTIARMKDRPLPSPEAAPDVFIGMLTAAGQGVSDLTAPQAWRHFGAFAQLPFDVPTRPGSEGFLYQYGTWNFTGQPLFYLDPVRQFAIPDEDEYLQFRCTLLFAPTPELDSLGSHEEWWWPEDGVPLSEWLTEVASRPEWAVLTAASPLDIEIGIEET